MSRRVAGWALLLYGVLGLLLVAGGAPTGLSLASSVERLSLTADGTLEAAIRSTDAAAKAFVNVDGSLSQAEQSADAAAALARDASGSLSSLAVAMQISLLGAQPLLPLASNFEDSAAQADALAGTLDGVAGSLGDSRVDIARIGSELGELSTELGVLREAGGSGASAPPIRLFVMLLLAWLLVPALGGVVTGIMLLRTPEVSRQSG
ncbi:MAG: hypothetical protein ACR2K4_03670 [Candidatus Limnocylindria bacterium]